MKKAQFQQAIELRKLAENQNFVNYNVLQKVIDVVVNNNCNLSATAKILIIKKLIVFMISRTDINIVNIKFKMFSKCLLIEINNKYNLIIY